MGVVYKAERTNPRRTVALKLIRKAVQGENAMRRFRLEAEALARLSHPGIAALYEIGLDQVSDQGDEQPYFAMELVEGVPRSRSTPMSARSRPASASRCSPASATRSTTPTRAASSTATSNPRTSSSRRRAIPRSSTSASPR
jgi:serine/threonine protein kinase